jgi:hypothetical protein
MTPNVRVSLRALFCLFLLGRSRRRDIDLQKADTDQMAVAIGRMHSGFNGWQE